MKKLLVAFIILASLTSSLAVAKSGPSLSIETSKIDVDQELGNVTYLDSGDEILPTVRYGYKFQLDKAFIRPSASYTFGDLEIQDTDGTSDTTTISKLFTAEADLGYNITNEFSIFGTLGFARANLERDVSNVKRDANGSGALFGFGLEYDISDSMSISARYQISDIDYSDIYTVDFETDMEIIKIGASYNF